MLKGTLQKIFLTEEFHTQLASLRDTIIQQQWLTAAVRRSKLFFATFKKTSVDVEIHEIITEGNQVHTSWEDMGDEGIAYYM